MTEQRAVTQEKHTPEPWVYSEARDTHDCLIHAANAIEEYGYISLERGGVVGSSEWTWLRPEDARRIVACVNACAGIPTHAVEASRFATLLSELADQQELLQEMAKALEGLLNNLGPDGYIPSAGKSATNAARAVRAKYAVQAKTGA